MSYFETAVTMVSMECSDVASFESHDYLFLCHLGQRSSGLAILPRCFTHLFSGWYVSSCRWLCQESPAARSSSLPIHGNANIASFIQTREIFLTYRYPCSTKAFYIYYIYLGNSLALLSIQDPQLSKYLFPSYNYFAT